MFAIAKSTAWCSIWRARQVLMALVLAAWEGQDVLGRALLVPAGPRATRRPPRRQLVARAPPNPSQGLVRELFEVPTPPLLPHPRRGWGGVVQRPPWAKGGHNAAGTWGSNSVLCLPPAP